MNYQHKHKDVRELYYGWSMFTIYGETAEDINTYFKLVMAHSFVLGVTIICKRNLIQILENTFYKDLDKTYYTQEKWVKFSLKQKFESFYIQTFCDHYILLDGFGEYLSKATPKELLFVSEELENLAFRNCKVIFCIQDKYLGYLLDFERKYDINTNKMRLNYK